MFIEMWWSMTRFYLLLLVTILTSQVMIAAATCKDCRRDIQLSLAESQDNNVSSSSSVPQGSPLSTPPSSPRVPISSSSAPSSVQLPISSAPPSSESPLVSPVGSSVKQPPSAPQVPVSPPALSSSPPLTSVSSPPPPTSFSVPQIPVAFTPKSSPPPASSELPLPSLSPVSSSFPGSKSLFPPLTPLLLTPPSSLVPPAASTLAPPPVSPPVLIPTPRPPPASPPPVSIPTPPRPPPASTLAPPPVSPPLLLPTPPPRPPPASPPPVSIPTPPSSLVAPPVSPPVLLVPPPPPTLVPPPPSSLKPIPPPTSAPLSSPPSTLTPPIAPRPSSPPPPDLPLPALPPFVSPPLALPPPPVLPLPALPPLSSPPPHLPVPPLSSLPPKSAPDTSSPTPVPSVTPPPTVTPSPGKESPTPSTNNSLPASPPPSESNSPETPPPTSSPPSAPPEASAPQPSSQSNSPRVPSDTPSQGQVPPPESSVLPLPPASAPASPPSVPIHTKTPAPAVRHFPPEIPPLAAPIQSKSPAPPPLFSPLNNSTAPPQASKAPPPASSADSTAPSPQTKDNSTAPSPQTRSPTKDNSTAPSPTPLSPAKHNGTAASPQTSAAPPPAKTAASPPVSPPPLSARTPQPPAGITPSPTRTELAQPPAMVFAPPPNAGCNMLCADPAVTTLAGTPCGCVIPMRVGLQLKIPISSFLNLVSELAKELATGTYVLQQQVQIVGASSFGENFADTEVKASLVPLGNAFTNETATHIASRLWLHQLPLDETLFVNYTVLYILYPGLPAYSSQNVIGSNKLPPIDGRLPEQPLGVDVHRNRNHKKLQPGIIAVITLGCILLLTVPLAVALFFIVHKRRSAHLLHSHLSEEAALGSSPKRSITTNLLSSNSPDSGVSWASSFMQFTSSVRTLTLAEIIKATDNFNPSHVIGEGGFGRVYSGVLDDGTKIAVKVLIREDQQGDREFAAEVEMLSRLHHRNLVKLVGICTEDDMRCLVYELIPNGSVESHLHGDDKERSPLTWEARLKIALGAARALAYLHEDSYPRVIHRDFKSSNILLEHDFTPKVSDFGLAKAASEELTGHISTRVMGTFGYVAPEYAMTGHLLVKSDVYSYGVVLLELLSGRKPVDMLRAAGQENLVTWARPLLTSLEGLEILVEPELKRSIPTENLAKLAAIASMCVQPEVSQRPFMSEVVQALKLVCNESDGDGDGDSGGETSNSKDKNYEDLSAQEWDTLSLVTRSDSFGAANQQYNRTLSASSVLLSWVPSSSGRHSAPETHYGTNNAGKRPPLRASRSDHEIAKCQR